MERTILKIPVFRPQPRNVERGYSPYPVITALLNRSPSSDPNNSPFVRDLDAGSIALNKRHILATPLPAASSSTTEKSNKKQNNQNEKSASTSYHADRKDPIEASTSDTTTQEKWEFKVIKTNDIDFPYQCAYCSLKTQNIDLLRPHSLKHIPGGTLQCILCNLTIRDYMEFKKHDRYNHPILPLTTITDRKHALEAFECPTCSKWISEHPNLQVIICFHRMPATYLKNQ